MPKSLHSPLYGRFRDLLVGARRARQLSQRQVAARLGRPQSYVSKYETGERDLNIVEFLAVARALEVDPLTVVRQLVEIERMLAEPVGHARRAAEGSEEYLAGGRGA